MKRFWEWLNNFLDGNKVILGTVLLLITTIPGVSVFLGASLEIIQLIISLLTGASLVDHARKGAFTTKKQKFVKK